MNNNALWISSQLWIKDFFSKLWVNSRLLYPSLPFPLHLLVINVLVELNIKGLELNGKKQRKTELVYSSKQNILEIFVTRRNFFCLFNYCHLFYSSILLFNLPQDYSHTFFQRIYSFVPLLNPMASLSNVLQNKTEIIIKFFQKL